MWGLLDFRGSTQPEIKQTKDWREWLQKWQDKNQGNWKDRTREELMETLWNSVTSPPPPFTATPNHNLWKHWSLLTKSLIMIQVNPIHMRNITN